MGLRLDLHHILCDILGTTHVYFQPPASVRMSFPCIIYSLKDIDAKYADDLTYHNLKCYTVTVVDRDPYTPPTCVLLLYTFYTLIFLYVLNAFILHTNPFEVKLEALLLISAATPNSVLHPSSRSLPKTLFPSLLSILGLLLSLSSQSSNALSLVLLLFPFPSPPALKEIV